MITVNQPIGKPLELHGKLILQYRGTNIQLINEFKNPRIDKAEFFESFETHPLNEKFCLKINLFDSTEILLCLSNKQLLWKGIANEKPIWLVDANGQILENEICWDNKNLFFIGRFLKTKINSLSDVQVEEHRYFIYFEIQDNLSKFLSIIKSEMKNGNLSNDIKMPL